MYDGSMQITHNELKDWIEVRTDDGDACWVFPTFTTPRLNTPIFEEMIAAAVTEAQADNKTPPL